MLTTKIIQQQLDVQFEQIKKIKVFKDERRRTCFHALPIVDALSDDKPINEIEYKEILTY